MTDQFLFTRNSWPDEYPVLLPEGLDIKEQILNIKDQKREFHKRYDNPGLNVLTAIPTATGTGYDHKRQAVIDDFRERCDQVIARIMDKYEVDRWFPAEVQRDTSAQVLAKGLHEFGFNLLPMVASLSDKGKIELIGLIDSNNINYKMFMLDLTGFISSFKTKFTTNVARDRALAKLLRPLSNTGIDGRDIKGFINNFVKPTEFRYIVKETVKDRASEDYRQISQAHHFIRGQ